ncbi:MAG TPA: sulfatase-like hydrolase/transferase [Chitinolyticbacter sp.]|nr:sulfatase-like hydrolase/transferase [Chitinolyticbacter sp.]
MIPRASCLASLLLATTPDLAARASTRPNILLIVADDLGYSDLGAFGGEIHTPNLDLLAAESRLLTQFHTAPTCSPTHDSLNSGADHHRVGQGSTAGMQQGQPGYEVYLNEHALSIAQLLKDGVPHLYRRQATFG